VSGDLQEVNIIEAHLAHNFMSEACLIQSLENIVSMEPCFLRHGNFLYIKKQVMTA